MMKVQITFRLAPLARLAIVIAVTMMTMMAGPLAAHEEQPSSPVVIDTDLGIDDLVALAMALQQPDLELAGLVASEGVADAATSTSQLLRLTDFLNRPDIQVSAAAPGDRNPPPYRARAQSIIEAALPSASRRQAQPFSPEAYRIPARRTTVLVLGPLTRLAAALTAEPHTVNHIERVIVAADPGATDDWNLGFDSQALAVIRSAGVPLIFVRPGSTNTKPQGWYTDRLTGGQGTALAELLLDRMLAEPGARTHYLRLGFHDELAMLYLLQPDLFRQAEPGIFEPRDSEAAADAVAGIISRGRQRKQRVVFIDTALPESVLQADVRARRAAILRKNGPDEWFAQLLLNELHEHLGAYSVIGVKMGLRAAELLNAPQHSMTIVSATPATQPVSCLNDGLLVATGSTPGRGLFSHEPGRPGQVEASFTYNGRTITLRLKGEYRQRIRSGIGDLLARFSLEDDAYWEGVRALGLKIWQDWHRRDLFEVEGLPFSILDERKEQK